MEILHAFFVAPFVDMWEFPVFLVEVVIAGLLTDVMYSLVALGFVLIFKASGVFNFSQGVMVLFAALTLVGLIEHGVPIWLALILTMLVMIALAFAVERVVLRPMVNQEPIIMFMATIGITFFLEGLGETLWGSNVKRLDIGIRGHFRIGVRPSARHQANGNRKGIRFRVVVADRLHRQRRSIGTHLRSRPR